MARHRKTFTVGWLYPDLMNIYGDRGNILTLLKRAEWRDYEARLIELGRGTAKRTNRMELVDITPNTLVGFENHSGRTYLGPRAKPLGRVRMGFGNNGEDHTEGCLQGGVLGTYLHGSLLPKNPHLADHLIRSALRRRGITELSRLDDSVELAAHERILERAGRP